MDSDLHDKHFNAVFSKEVIEMFADIVSNDLAAKKVFVYIGRTLNNRVKQEKQDDDAILGVTVNDIVEHVMLERKEKVTKGKSFTYRYTTTNIERKTAERTVDKLLCMSLIYFNSVKPYKFLYMTKRGWQVMEEYLNRLSKGAKNENG